MDFCELFWHYETVSFDLITPKVDLFMPLPHRLLEPSCIKISSLVFVIPCSHIRWQRSEWIKYIMPVASIVWWKHSKCILILLRCLQKEIATYRHWSVSLWRDPDDVSHCRILSPDKTEWLAAYLGYTLRMKTLFCGWPVVVDDTHTRRKRSVYWACGEGCCVIFHSRCYVDISYSLSIISVNYLSFPKTV